MQLFLYKNVLRFVLNESKEGESRISYGTKFQIDFASRRYDHQKTIHVWLEHKPALVHLISKSSYYLIVCQSTCHKYI